MNRIQYRRWKDFALRMADNGWPKRITRTKHHKAIVRPAVEHIFELIEWNKEPEIIRILSWDHNREPASPDKWCADTCVGDEVSRILDEYWNPGHDNQYKKWDELWGGRVRCCIRAGLDLVSEPSCGVVGFCKEDIERMYPEGVPKWIKAPWGHHQNGAWGSVGWDDINKEDVLWL